MPHVAPLGLVGMAAWREGTRFGWHSCLASTAKTLLETLRQKKRIPESSDKNTSISIGLIRWVFDVKLHLDFHAITEKILHSFFYYRY
jgi:hypothetical protein